MDKEQILKIYHEEIKVVQEIIKRMAANSFQLKGWAVTLVAATLVLKVAAENKNVLWIAYIPLLMFWGLDAYYLRQEKLFREIHKWIITNRLSDNSTDKRKMFDMNPQPFEKEVESTFSVAFSDTIVWFYFPLVVLIGLFIVFMPGK